VANEIGNLPEVNGQRLMEGKEVRRNGGSDEKLAHAMWTEDRRTACED